LLRTPDHYPAHAEGAEHDRPDAWRHISKCLIGTRVRRRIAPVWCGSVRHSATGLSRMGRWWRRAIPSADRHRPPRKVRDMGRRRGCRRRAIELKRRQCLLQTSSSVSPSIPCSSAPPCRQEPSPAPPALPLVLGPANC
jgi:hypothetical protein